MKKSTWNLDVHVRADEAADPNGGVNSPGVLRNFLSLALAEIERLQEEVERHDAQIDQVADALEKSAEAFVVIAQVFRKNGR